MKRMFSKLNALILALAVVALSDCASGPHTPESRLDTPELYVSNGFIFIQKGLLDDAEREFNKAIRYDSGSADAFAGLALVTAYKGERESALSFMRRSASLAKTLDEEYRVHVGWIRLHTVLKREGWLSESEKAYSRASSMKKDSPEAYYYMGLAYKQGYRISKARTAFLKVQEIRKSLAREAGDELGILRRIESARPVSEIGRKMVVEERVSRAEMAALFFHELGIGKILNKAGDRPGRVHSAPAPDLSGHPLRSSVEEVLPLNIKGLALYGDGTFGPNESVTRSAFAVMLADIICRAENDPTLISRYAGRSSPFPDVKNDASYLGAIHVCIARGAGLQTENGTFNPMGILTGYDAVLSIQKIREKLLKS